MVSASLEYHSWTQFFGFESRLCKCQRLVINDPWNATFDLPFLGLPNVGAANEQGLCNRGSYSIYVILLAVRVCQKILGRQEPWFPFGFPCMVNWLLSYTSAGGHCWCLGRADKAQWTLWAKTLGKLVWNGCDAQRTEQINNFHPFSGQLHADSPWLAPSIWFRLAWEMEEVPKLSYPIVIHSYPIVIVIP